jgi:hypothetical protein
VSQQGPLPSSSPTARHVAACQHGRLCARASVNEASRTDRQKPLPRIGAQSSECRGGCTAAEQGPEARPRFDLRLGQGPGNGLILSVRTYCRQRTGARVVHWTLINSASSGLKTRLACRQGIARRLSICLPVWEPTAQLELSRSQELAGFAHTASPSAH